MGPGIKCRDDHKRSETFFFKYITTENIKRVWDKGR